jgi:anti-anti-sigma factor
MQHDCTAGHQRRSSAFLFDPSQGGFFMAANPIDPVPELRLDTEETATETIFRCIGRITSATAAQLQSTVRKAISEKKSTVLDLSQVTFMDSSGLGALVRLYVSAKTSGREMKLVSLSPRVKELLHLTSLDKLFAVSQFPDTPAF